MQGRILSGKHQTWIYESGDPIATFFVPVDDDARISCESMFFSVARLSQTPCRIVCFPVHDWDRSLTPWPASPVFRSQSFDGCAAETLQFVLSDLLPDYQSGNNLTAGYSLAGLFSLWCLTQTDVFCGAASCSGSLWYPQFSEYLRSAALPSPCMVYLSLGDLEEKAKNPVLKTIGSETRAVESLLSERQEVAGITLEMNRGNHFTESDLRTAKGIAWLSGHLPSVSR